MALIKCSECGHEVSDKASVCPNCGNPIASVEVSHEEMVMMEDPQNRKGWLIALVIVIVGILGTVGYYAYSLFSNNNEEEAIVELTPEFIKAIEKYDQLGIFSEGYAAIKKGDKWGYINTKGEEVIPTTIEAYCVGRFSEGLAFVAKGMESDFYVIDKQGKTIFQGTDSHFDSDFPESSEMPYFVNSKIYVPTSATDYNFVIYDIKGKKVGTSTWEERDSIYKANVNSKYIAFAEDTEVVGEEEERVSRTKWGIKDSIGNVVLASKYDEIVGNNGHDEKMNISNGVILVVLEEPQEGEFTSGNAYDPSIRHYGYADLKGNDTFSEALKERCRKAERTALDNYKAYLDEQNSDEDYIVSNDRIILDDDNPSYSSEREITIYMAGNEYQGEYSSLEGNYGCNSYYGDDRNLWSNTITVPQGKVWIFKSYNVKCPSNCTYTAGFLDSRGCFDFWVNNSSFKHLRDMSGERLYSGKRKVIGCHFWAYSEDYSPFRLEVTFIERDE